MIFDTETYFNNIASANNWGFSYGRKDYQNIYDITTNIKDKLNNEEKDIILYCHELNQDLISNTVSFEILLAQKSDFKEGSYSNRNKQHILPLKRKVSTIIINELECKNDVSKCLIYDRINEFDNNLDGVLANITLKYYDE